MIIKLLLLFVTVALQLNLSAAALSNTTTKTTTSTITNHNENELNEMKFRLIEKLMQNKRLPQAIIIGAKKSGTRALLKFIGSHQNVSAAGAETHFFDRFYHMGTDWYRSQMPYSSKHNALTIEKTPKYFIDPHVPERVYRLNPNMKLIVVLRDPVTRAVSEYVQAQLKKGGLLNYFNKQHLNESARFSKMLYDNESDIDNRMIRTEWPIVRNGIYYRHLLNWLAYFPLEQFLFVNGEQLIKEPSVELNKVQQFLNLQPLIQKKHFVHNRRKGFACIYHPLDVSSTSLTVKREVKCLSDQKGRQHPKIDQNILNDLRNFYRPYDQMLFKLINQTPWWPL